MQELTLKRVMGRLDLTAIGVNQVIGSGIFVLPATVAVLVGVPASPLAWVIGAVVNGLVFFCFANAASRFREAGGPYLYAREAFGKFVGFEVGWIIWLTRVITQAALANAFSIYLAYFLPALDQGLGRIVTITILLATLTLVNWRGVREGSWTVNLFAFAKLIPLLVFCLAGLVYVNWDTFSQAAQAQWSGFGGALVLIIFAFGGFELITLPAGEAKAPRRDVPAALLLTFGAVSVLYILVQFVTAGTLPHLTESNTPLADAAALFLGPLGGTLIAIGGLLAIAGGNAGTMLAGPRVTYAMAAMNQLPGLFAKIHPRFRTPTISIAVYSLTALGLALTGSFVQLASLSAVARLLFYATTCVSILVLRKGRSESKDRIKNSWLPIAGAVASGTIILAADLFSLAVTGVALAAGALVYLIRAKLSDAEARN